MCERVGGGEFTFGVETYKASIERVTFRLNLKEGRREMAFSARHAPFSAWLCVKASPPSAVGEPLLFFECFPQLPLMLSRWSQWRGMYRHLPCSGSGSAVCAASMDFIVDPKS